MDLPLAVNSTDLCGGIVTYNGTITVGNASYPVSILMSARQAEAEGTLLKSLFWTSFTCIVVTFSHLILIFVVNRTLLKTPTRRNRHDGTEPFRGYDPTQMQKHVFTIRTFTLASTLAEVKTYLQVNFHHVHATHTRVRMLVPMRAHTHTHMHTTTQHFRPALFDVPFPPQNHKNIRVPAEAQRLRIRSGARFGQKGWRGNFEVGRLDDDDSLGASNFDEFTVYYFS